MWKTKRENFHWRKIFFTQNFCKKKKTLLTLRVKRKTTYIIIIVSIQLFDDAGKKNVPKVYIFKNNFLISFNNI